jgi:hypothetical protein
MSSEPSADGTLSPKQMYSIARDMIPCEEKKFELAHLRALLLHSLVLIGQGANLSAWMLVGTATRLALHMRETGELFARSNTPIDSVWPGGARAFAACFVLDTMTSACLGQPTFIKAESQELIASLESLVGASRPELWAPIVGFSSDHVNADESQHISIQPLQTFHQLIRFMLILSTSMDASRHGGGGASRKTPEDLVKCLDPEYAFCNTVVFGSAPPVPSAFLLQAIFLACTIYLVRSYRSSLLSSFMEGVESGVSEFGRCASSPFVVCLLGIVQRCGHLDRMHEAERSKWQSTLDSLKALWTQNSVEQSNYIPSNSHTATTVQHLSPNVVQLSPAAFSSVNYNGSHGIITPAQTDSGYNILRADDSSTRPQTYTYEGHGFPMYPPSRSPGNPNPMVSASSTLPFQPSAGSDQAAVYQPDAVAAAGQAVDYDAMLDELGSIDYPDGLDMDPQFMTNLGFAPGCDLGEIFQGDFGLQ